MLLPRLIDTLLALHRALIDWTKREYERDHGPVQNPYQLFALVSQDPAFQWLQPLTKLLVELEELRDRTSPPLAPEELSGAAARIRLLLVSTDAGFAAKLTIAVDAHQGATASHQALRSLLDQTQGP